MRHLTKGIAALAAGCLLLLAGACNKGPADTALTSAEQALAAARPEIARYLPQELAALEAAIRDARAQIDAGRYTDALKAAQALPGRIRAAQDAAAKQKEQLTAVWSELSGRVPQAVEDIDARLAALRAGKAVPPGMTQEMLAGVQGELASVRQAWTAAAAAFQSGEVPKAVEAAQAVKVRLDSLAGMLGRTSVAPAPTVAEH